MDKRILHKYLSICTNPHTAESLTSPASSVFPHHPILLPENADDIFLLKKHPSEHFIIKQQRLYLPVNRLNQQAYLFAFLYQCPFHSINLSSEILFSPNIIYIKKNFNNFDGVKFLHHAIFSAFITSLRNHFHQLHGFAAKRRSQI